MEKQIQNKVLKQAWKDYDPKIVRVNANIIEVTQLKDTEQHDFVNNENPKVQKMELREAVGFLLALNSINYQFWSLGEDGKFVRYQNEGSIGALAMVNGFEKLHDYIKENNYNTQLLTEDIITHFFGDIPEKQERISILKESLNQSNIDKVLSLMLHHIEKEPINVELAYQVAKILPLSYQDEYLKKIQLALYEIGATFNRVGMKVDVDVTVAADYQIPKVLEGLNFLTYSKELSQKINNEELIEPGSKEEKALRAATILACNEIALKNKITIPALDRMLWLVRNDFKEKKFHLTRTTKY